jgi:hypothetical protein
MAFKPKAEIQFEAKTKLAVEARDWNEVAHLFHLFGCYLELIAPIPDPNPAPLPEPTGKEVVYVQPNEPTPAEEQVHVLSGGSAEFAIRVLHADPVTLEPLTAAQLESYGIMDHDRGFSMDSGQPPVPPEQLQ